MMFINLTSTTSITFFVLLFSLMVSVTFGFPKPEELEPSCNYGCLESAFKDCVTDTLKPAHPNNFKDRPVKVGRQSAHYIVLQC